MSKIDITAGGLENWAADSEGVLVTWLFNDGAMVKEGDVVAEVMLEKVEMEVEAPAAGKLSIQMKADDVIAHDTVLGTIEAG